jgi:uncharacterized integral membrane protein
MKKGRTTHKKRATFWSLLRASVFFGIVAALSLMLGYYAAIPIVLLIVGAANLAMVEAERYTNVPSAQFPLIVLFFLATVVLSVAFFYLFALLYG